MDFPIAKPVLTIITVIVVIASVVFLLRDSNDALASTLDTFGIGDPRIGQFSAEVKDLSTFKLSYAILRDIDKVEKAVITREYKHFPDQDFEQFGEPKKVHEISASSLINRDGKVEVPVPIIDCFPEDVGCVQLVTDKLGVHSFRLQVFGVEGNVFDSETKVIGVYNEPYVELFKGKVEGEYYDVPKCKVDVIEPRITGTPLRTLNENERHCEKFVTDALKSLCDQFRSKDNNINSNCNCRKKGFPGCTDEQKDKFHFEAGRAWVWRDACYDHEWGNQYTDVLGNEKLDPDITNLERLYSSLTDEQMKKHIKAGVYGRQGEDPDLSITGCGAAKFKEEPGGVQIALDELGFIPLDRSESRAKRGEEFLAEVANNAKKGGRLE